MNRFIFKFCLRFAVILYSLPLVAQQEEKPYLEYLLESTLSSPDMMVSVTGLQGAFSTSAQVDRVDFSDNNGIWLSIENAELNWTRSALLQKKLEIETLSADKITIFRKPLQSNSSPSPEADTFRVPELPVSVNIQNITTNELILGQDIFGRAARLKIDGYIKVIDGDFDIAIQADNLENEGAFDLTFQLDTLQEQIAISLKAEEAANGLLVNVLDIPDKPSLSIELIGEGLVSAFNTDIQIATNGSDRLIGQVLVEPNLIESRTDGVKITAALNGNLTPLFEQQYQGFFGETASLNAIAKWRETGEISVSELDIKTAALNAVGFLELASDYTPSRIQLTTSISDASGLPVLLPLTGPETSLKSAEVFLDYDVEKLWTGTLQIADLSYDGLFIKGFDLQSTGEMPNAFTSVPKSGLFFSAKFNAVATGVKHIDDGLDRAIGNDIRTSGEVTFNNDSPVIISGLILTDGNISAEFNGQVDGLETALLTSGELFGEIDDVSVFTDILGQQLTGNVDLNAKGNVGLLTGAFELDIETNGNAISIKNLNLDPLLQGYNTAVVSAKRTKDGLFFENFVFSNPQVSAQANGQMKDDDAVINLSATVKNSNIISDALIGPITAGGSVRQNGDLILVDIKSTGISGLRADISGIIPVINGDWNLAASGDVPLALFDQLLASSSAKTRGNAQFDVALNGVPSLQSISGKIVTNNASIALPTQSLTLEKIKGEIRIANGVADTDVVGELATGGRLIADGQISLNQTQGFPADMQIQLSDIVQRERNSYRTKINGNLKMSGPLSIKPKLSGQIDLSETELSLQGTSAPQLSFIPEIVHENEPVESFLTRLRSGLVSTTDAGSNAAQDFDIDITVNAPTRIFVRGRGLDAELGGSIRLTGTTQSARPVGAFNLIRGRLDVLGKRLVITEANISMAGALDPRLNIVATTDTDDYETSVIISGLLSAPQFSFTSSPELPEDEVLAQIFFGRGLDQISAFQAIQLAAAVREFTGNGGRSITERIRRKLGVDDFAIETDDDGNTGARAGKYISENVYTDVTIAGNGQSEISINLDLNKNLSASGVVTEDGKRKLGVFFNKDY